MPLGLTASLKASVGGASVPLTPPTNVTPCTVTFVPQAGSALVGDAAVLDVPGVWTGSPVLTYQWLRNGSIISGATGTSYILTEADADQTISLRETATNGSGSDEAISSNNVIPAELAAPTLNGDAAITSPVVDIVLTEGTPTGTTGNPPATDSYQWQADTDYDFNFADLPGETASTIAAPAAGRNYQLVVTRTNSQGFASTTSNTVPK